jgi:hypothetical protein
LDAPAGTVIVEVSCVHAPALVTTEGVLDVVR